MSDSDSGRNAWDPDRYRQFATERAQPFHDLLDLVEPARITRAVDLGCGPGELTALAAHQLGARHITGIDSSEAMLTSAADHATAKVQFSSGDIGAWTSDRDHDLVLANASLQWVPDHAAVLERWTRALGAGGQIAVQVPANPEAPIHVVADEIAHRQPYLSAFGPTGPPPDPVAVNVLAPEHYAQLLFDLGYEHQHVRLTVYPHVLPSTRFAVDWATGTTLNRFKARLSDDLFRQFLVDYETRYVEIVGAHEPYFFPFRRILMWARRPA